MYVLVVRDPEGNETEYDLVGEAVLGRDEGADVQMPGAGVSRRHARVFLEDGLCYVEDLGSANGTLLDGEAVVGQVVLEPGRIVSLGPFELWVEEPEGAADAHSEARAAAVVGDVATGRWDAPAGSAGRRLLGTLEGISGGALGQIFELRSGVIVGRLPGVDVVVDDPSMSRKHAEIELVDGEVVVRDLESANGTFVNEMPVIEQALVDGDIVTFGSVAFRFSPVAGLEDEAASPMAGLPRGAGTMSARRGRKGKAAAHSRRKLLILGVVGVLTLLIVVVAVGGRDTGTPPAGQPGVAKKSAADDLRTEVFNLMRRAQMLMESESWEQAEDILARVVELDPINADARARLRQARLEVEMQELFDEAGRLTQIGSLEDALETYMRIDAESAYRRRARFQVHQIVERLQTRYDGECRGFVRANRFKEALVPCRRYMDFACQCPGSVNERVEQALARAERMERVPARERWRCPTGLEEWMPCATRVVVGDHDPERAISEKYTHEGIAGAVRNYYHGQLDDALRELGRIEDRRGVDLEVQEQARDLRRQMRFVQGKFRQGQTELLRGAIDAAHSEWGELIDIDSRILPETLQSSMRREAVRRLSGAYHERGFELQRMRRYPEAFDWYRKGYSVNPDDTRIGEGLSFLERAAFHYLRRAQTCGELRQILRYTMDDPPSAAHQQVKQALADRGC